MTGRTHFAIGANMTWLIFLTADRSWIILVLPLLAGVVALLPDLDNQHAQIHQWTKGILRLFLIDRLRHRSLLHSLIILPVVGFLFSFLYFIYPLAPIIFLLAYASHGFIDGFNPQGVEYLYPWTKNLRLIPRFLTVKTGGWVDHGLFILGSLGMIVFLLMFFGLIKVVVV